VAARVVDLFPEKTIAKAVRLSSSGYFVRDAHQVMRATAEALADKRLANSGHVTDQAELARWVPVISRLVSRLVGPAPAHRVYTVVTWYRDQPTWRKDKYLPRVDTAKTLREKFDRLEAAMHSRMDSSEPDDEIPRDVLRAAVGGDGPVLTSIERDVFAPARKLRLTGDDLGLARALARLHASIRAERAAAGVSDDLVRQLGGAVGLLARYVAFLGDQGWVATLRVLQPDSPAFAQFRRGQAQLDARDRDPVTGKSH